MIILAWQIHCQANIFVEIIGMLSVLYKGR